MKKDTTTRQSSRLAVGGCPTCRNPILCQSCVGKQKKKSKRPGKVQSGVGKINARFDRKSLDHSESARTKKTGTTESTDDHCRCNRFLTTIKIQIVSA